MAVVRVFRTRDRRWRVELLDDGRMNVVEGGFLVLRRASVDAVGDWLAERGVRADDLIED